MLYTLRVNHHAADHGALILDGIRPALQRAGCTAALRPHWQQGPHLLIAPAVDAAAVPVLSTRLAADIQAWLDAAPRSTRLTSAAPAWRFFKVAMVDSAVLAIWA